MKFTKIQTVGKANILSEKLKITAENIARRYK